MGGKVEGSPKLDQEKKIGQITTELLFISVSGTAHSILNGPPHSRLVNENFRPCL